MRRRFTSIKGITIFILSMLACGGCASFFGQNVEVSDSRLTPDSLGSIDTILVRRVQQTHLELPMITTELSHHSETGGEFRSHVPEAVIRRGKEGLGGGALLGSSWNPSYIITTNKGNVLLVALALGFISVGSAVGGSVGLVEGVIDDLAQLKDRMRGVEDGRFSNVEIQGAMKRIQTGEKLVEQINQLTNGANARVVRTMLDTQWSQLESEDKTLAPQVLFVDILETDFVQPSQEEPLSFLFRLAVRTEVYKGYGEVLDTRTFTYKSATSTLKDWARNNGQRFKNEHERACRQIAEEIARIYVTRVHQ